MQPNFDETENKKKVTKDAGDDHKKNIRKEKQKPKLIKVSFTTIYKTIK